MFIIFKMCVLDSKEILNRVNIIACYKPEENYSPTYCRIIKKILLPFRWQIWTVSTQRINAELFNGLICIIGFWRKPWISCSSVCAWSFSRTIWNIFRYIKHVIGNGMPQKLQMNTYLKERSLQFIKNVNHSTQILKFEENNVVPNLKLQIISAIVLVKSYL